jgi:2-oxoglutarate dehydrogenase E2 component (dihydrolipoamide succinyltransferase)
MLLAASTTFAQAPAPARPAGQAPAPAAPRPAAPAPAPAVPAAPPVKFQDGLKYAYIRIDRIAAESGEARCSTIA